MTEEKVYYNDIPVYYCKKCLSLKIKGVGDLDYCGNCGSTDIDQAHIKYWDNLFVEKYGKHFINKEEDGRN